MGDHSLTGAARDLPHRCPARVAKSLEHRPSGLEPSRVECCGVKGGRKRTTLGRTGLLVVPQAVEALRGRLITMVGVTASLVAALALVVFIVNGQVEWTLGLLLGVGQAVGAWAAARMAVKRGAEFVRWMVIAIVVVSAIALFAGVN